MLNQQQLHFGTQADEAGGLSKILSNPLSGIDLLAMIKRQVGVLAICAAFCLILGGVFLAQSIPTYTSSVSILIDAKKVGMTASSALEGSMTFDTGAVDSQLQILLSDKLASNVAARLGLQNNMTFLDPRGSIINRAVRKLVGASTSFVNLVTGTPASPQIKDLPESIRLLIATNILQNRLKVQRVGRTYVFALDYTDTDPLLAQSIAGQFANAYLEDQLDSKFDSTRRATNWMEERIRDLKARSLAADEAVQKYRADNNLIAASGRLIDDQSLTDATTQLASARNGLNTASARYQRLKQIIDNQDVNGGLTESLSNPNVAALRGKYLEAAKLASEISARYGEDHQAAVKAKKDMAEYTRLIFEELQNLLPGYQSDVAIAQSQVTSVQATIDQLRQASTNNDSAMVKLRALEQEADTLKTLYSTFLQKSQELQQQQSFPVTDARLISDASTPMTPSGPKKLLVMLSAFLLGITSGGLIAMVREWRDRGFRTPSQVRDELGLEFIANVPLFNPSMGADVQIPSTDQVTVSSTIQTSNRALTKTIDDPFSQFAEAIRAIRVRIAFEYPKRKGVVLGILSMFPDEGKSTIAKNLGSSIALQGAKTLLIDGDFRNPSLTKDLSPDVRSGLVDVVRGKASLDETIRSEKNSGLFFMPNALRGRPANDVFGSTQAQSLLEFFREKFDVTLIDFPPVAALTDALAANNLVDGYIIVTQWGKTPRSVVRDFVANNTQVVDKILGVVLNKVDLRRLRKYGGYQSSPQYTKYSERYFSAKHKEIG